MIAVYRRDTGELVSLASEVHEQLPDDLDKVTVEIPASGRWEWDPAAKAVVERPMYRIEIRRALLDELIEVGSALTDEQVAALMTALAGVGSPLLTAKVQELIAELATVEEAP